MNISINGGLWTVFAHHLTKAAPICLSRADERVLLSHWSYLHFCMQTDYFLLGELNFFEFMNVCTLLRTMLSGMICQKCASLYDAWPVYK